MPNLYFGKLAPTSQSATSAQTGYGVDNLLLESIARAWRSTDTTQQDIEYLFAVGKTVQAVFITEVNFASCEVYAKVGAGAYGAKLGDLTTYAGKEGRRRGVYVIGGTANVTGIKLRILNGAATDGLAYKRIGALYVFSTVAALPANEWGYNAIWKAPRVSTALVNGQRPRASAGSRYHLITTKINARPTEDWTAFFAALDAGTCLFTMNLPAPRQWQSWPVILENDDVGDTSTSLAGTEFEVTLREIV